MSLPIWMTKVKWIQTKNQYKGEWEDSIQKIKRMGLIVHLSYSQIRNSLW
jgi:hypothetical protein